jgi:hypothetical protein
MTKWSPISAAGNTPPRRFRGNIILILILLVCFQLYFIGSRSPTLFRRTVQVPLHAERSLARCASLKVAAGPPANFHDRKASDRFVPGTKATLLHNARIWTGEKNGTEILHGDVFFDKGIIQGVGSVNLTALRLDLDGMIARGELNVVDVRGAWVTPGYVRFGFSLCLPGDIDTPNFQRLVDPHSHLGDASSPALDGASGDDNSFKGTVQPWLRSLDGLNTHDDSYYLSIAGGVTTAIVLPGSANAIGYLAFQSSRQCRLRLRNRWSGIYNQATENGRTLANFDAARATSGY